MESEETDTMKCKKTEYGVELIPETDHERECLKHLERQSSVTITFEDTWNKTGNLQIEGKPHPWDKQQTVM
jgi:hypothetical protein